MEQRELVCRYEFAVLEERLDEAEKFYLLKRIGLRWIPVVRLPGNDPPYATARIGHVSAIARDHVDVAMQHSLASLYSIVGTHVEAVRWSMGAAQSVSDRHD